MLILSRNNGMNVLSLQRFLAVGVLITSAFVLSGCGLKDQAPPSYLVSLEVWGVFDDSDAYTKAFSEYQRINPYIKGIQYRKLAPETYKEDLVNAFASGKGPDIFMIRNSWRLAFEDKTAPAPAELLTERVYRDAFVDVVASDFIGTENKIYGVPLSADSLALYYNKDLFNAAGISEAPKTWDEVASLTRRLTTLDQFGNVTLSGVAMGTGTNINRSSDILTALMMQLGSELKEPKKSGRVSFIDQPSRQALDFYTQFAKIGSPSYSWNARQHYSIDSFYEGTAAMMINYSWQYDTIKQKNAKLNIGVAKLPQFNADAPVNLGNYWGYAVSKENSKEVDPFASASAPPMDPAQENYLRTFEAWQFLKFLTLEGNDKKMTLMNGLAGTTKEVVLEVDPTADYLAKTKKPAARRDIVEQQQNDVRLAPFAYGNLIAKNWYQGNPEAVDGIFVDMIEAVVRGEKSSQDALSTAANRINLLSR